MRDAPADGEPRAGVSQVHAEAESAAVPERLPRVRLEPGRKKLAGVSAAGGGRRRGPHSPCPSASWRARGQNLREGGGPRVRCRRRWLRGCHRRQSHRESTTAFLYSDLDRANVWAVVRSEPHTGGHLTLGCMYSRGAQGTRLLGCADKPNVGSLISPRLATETPRPTPAYGPLFNSVCVGTTTVGAHHVNFNFC